MARNPVLGGKHLFLFVMALAALGSLTGCNNTLRDPWNKPRTSQQQAVPAQPAATGMVDPSLQAMPPAQARPAKVAILLPLSGKGSDTGQAMLNASQLAIFDLGADMFELNPIDTKGTPDGANAAALTAINDGAQLLLGPVFAAEAKAVKPLAVQRNIGSISFSTDSSVAGGTSFVSGFLPQTQIHQIIDFAAGQGMPRIALIAAQDTYGDLATLAFESYIRQRSLMNAGVVRFNPATGATPAQIAALVKGSAANALQPSAKPFDAVLIAASGTQSAQISQLLSQAGLPSTAVQRLGTGLWDQADVARQPALQGAWYATASPRLRQKFEARYVQTYGETPPRLATLAYDATALAIVLAKSGQDYNRSALTNPNGFSGIDGIFRFRPDGLIERGLAIVEIRNNAPAVIREAPTSFQSIGG